MKLPYFIKRLVKKLHGKAESSGLGSGSFLHRMSLRQALRSKFRSEKTDSERECESPGVSTKALTFTGLHDDEMCLMHEDMSGNGEEYSNLDKHCIPDSCHLLFETQLNQLQEQLVATMLENQQLTNELKQLREELCLEQLSKQLEKEREKNRFLMEKLTEKETKEPVGSKSPRLRRLVKREKHLEKTKSLDQPLLVPGSSGSPSSTATLVLPTPERDDWIDLTCREDLFDEEDDPYAGHSGLSFVPPSLSLAVGWRQRLWTWAHDLFLELMEDFTETTLDEEDVAMETDKEGDPLTVRKLKENIVRFGHATKPVSNAIDRLYTLLRWESPGSTLLAFSVYTYTVYYGWFLPLFLFLVCCQFVLNYLRNRGWLSALSVSKKTEIEDSDKDMGVSDKFQLVLHVARKVQNKLGHIADCFEKLKSLFLWQQSDVTAHLFLYVLAMFVAACFFPANQLFTAAGLYLGVKLFLVDYIFYLFPRVRQKHDATLRMWLSLPTDAQLEKRHTRAEIDRNLINQNTSLKVGSSQQSLTAENQSFCDLFSLPASETPLPTWHNGRRCTLINRDKSLTSAFKNGRLYLTNSFLCFERSKTANLKNIVLPLRNIAKLEKSKPYPWMPGGGMALEVTLEKPDKTYIFGAILNRDETYEGILEAGRKAGLHWAQVLYLAATEQDEATCSKKLS